MEPDDLAVFVAASPRDSIRAIAEALETGRVNLTSSSVGIDGLPDVGPDTATLAVKLFASARSKLTPTAVASGLRAANAMRDLLASTAAHVDVVWSGPLVEGATARNTSDVILEMVRFATAPGEILVVGYSLTSTVGSVMHHVVDAFLEASARGVTLTFVLHAEGEGSANKHELMKGWDVLERKPRILTWRPRAAHAFTKMHAKALVVNRIDALVTSANLTFHGLESNLELGIRVRGDAASAIASRFDRLAATGALVPWDDSPGA